MSRRRSRSGASLAALLLVLLLAAAHAALDPSRVGEAEFVIREHRLINATTDAVFNLTINLSLPIGGRLTNAPAGAELVKDAWGNPYLAVFEPSPRLPYRFTADSSVIVHDEPLRELPASFRLDSNLTPYLRPTPAAPSADPQMVALARNITAGSASPFESVARLAQWVHDRIQYDSSYVDQYPDARSILAQRRGVCTEYALLFATLARSAGYPTRFVGGFAYSSDAEAWQGHAWTEVWLGRWVPVDPTWLEVGSVDATHIALSKSPEPRLDSISISAMVRGQGALALERSPSAGLRADQVGAVRLTPRLPDVPLEMHASSDTLPPGGRALVWAAYTSDRYALAQARLTPCASSGDEIIRVFSPVQTLIARPNRTYYLFWTAQAASSADPQFIYRCPLSLHFDLSEPAGGTLSVSDELSTNWPALSAQAERTRLQAGERLRVFVRLPSSMAGQTVHLLEPTLHLQSPLDRDGRAAFDFVVQGPGKHTLYLFSSSGDPQSLDYEVVTESLPALSATLPGRPVVAGQSFQLPVRVDRLNLSGPRLPARLAWSFDEASGEQSLEDASGLFSIPLRASSEGESLLVLRLLAADGEELARQVVPVQVEARTDLALGSIRLQSYSSDGWRVLVEVNRTGPVRQPRLVSERGTWPIGNDNLAQLTLAPGRYPMRLEWSDSAGQIHQSDIVLDVQPSLPALVPPAPAQSYGYDVRVLPVLVGLALLFAALLGAAVYLRVGSVAPPSEPPLGLSDPPHRTSLDGPEVLSARRRPSAPPPPAAEPARPRLPTLPREPPPYSGI